MARARLAAVLREVAWRNDKASVADELGLPPRALQARSRLYAQHEKGAGTFCMHLPLCVKPRGNMPICVP